MLWTRIKPARATNVQAAFHNGPEHWNERNWKATMFATLIATARQRSNDACLMPPRSTNLFRWFARYARRYFCRHFHALRLAGDPPNVEADRPLVIYLNHPSWWDPIVCVLLAEVLFRDRVHYGPIDAAALGRYGIFRRLGFFGVELNSARGAKVFLRTSQWILSRPGAVLWMTPEGRFSHPLQRPVVLRPGLAHLARRVRQCLILPMAVDYAFWQERTPEVLIRFGRLIDSDTQPRQTVDRWQHVLQENLGAAQDELAELARKRSPADFTIMLGGRAGVGGIYDLWRRTTSRLSGEVFREEHGI